MDNIINTEKIVINGNSIWTKHNIATGIGGVGESFIKKHTDLTNTVYFAKSNPTVIIPSKTEENAGFDIYANFDEDYIVLEPHETKIIPTGIHSAFNSEYFVMLKERGSTGSRGMAVRMGVVDSGYRGEWLVGITNTTNKTLFISKLSEKETIRLHCEKETEENYVFYPYSKAVCQAVILPVPKMISKEISLDELKLIPSDRGMGMFGSSGK